MLRFALLLCCVPPLFLRQHHAADAATIDDASARCRRAFERAAAATLLLLICRHAALMPFTPFRRCCRHAADRHFLCRSLRLFTPLFPYFARRLY